MDLGFLGGPMERFYYHCRNQKFNMPANFTGNRAVLDFVNTLRNTRKKDYLVSYDAYLYWCLQVGIIDGATYETLQFKSYCEPVDAGRQLKIVQAARYTFIELFDAILAGEPVPVYTAEAFNRLTVTVNQHISYRYDTGVPRATWIDIQEEMGWPLWMLVVDARNLVRPGYISKLKKCPGCGSLFMDVTRNNTRTWCNPGDCGKQLRNKRYYKAAAAYLSEGC